jgi:POTRA domain-containing FtsQ-type protein
VTTPPIDSRIEERRLGVSEDNARRRLRRLLLLAGLIGVAALVAWLLQSPVFAVRDVVVRGAENSTAAQRLEAMDVVAGVPTMSVNASEVQDELASDPWIRDSRVVVQWPGHVEVDVAEYIAAASVLTESSWVLVSAEGRVLDTLDDRVPTLGSVELVADPVRPGEQIDNIDVVAAIRFIDVVGDGVTTPIVVWNEGNELVALVDGYRVRIGPSVDVEAKAVAVIAILADGLPEGSIIDVVSPSRPAVAIPQPVVEE